MLPFPEDVIKELKRLTLETLEEEAAKDETFKQVYKSFKAFQTKHAAWTAIADDAYNKALTQ